MTPKTGIRSHISTTTALGLYNTPFSSIHEILYKYVNYHQKVMYLLYNTAIDIEIICKVSIILTIMIMNINTYMYIHEDNFVLLHYEVLHNA